MKQKYSQILENDGVGREYFGRMLGRGLSKEEIFKLRSEQSEGTSWEKNQKNILKYQHQTLMFCQQMKMNLKK